MGIDPLTLDGAVTIYKHRRTGAYRIQPMCARGSLGLAEAGEAAVVSAEDGEAALVRLIESALASYRGRQYDQSGSPLFSRAEYARFVREHDAIMVVRDRSGRIELVPWERQRGGYKALSAAALALVNPAGEDLVAAIRETLRRAA